ncbi:MAG TPA: anti-sigma factor [Sphingomicrobium sp.]|nr:anti-sigma factor [Sphingomicrobium sp.]
MVNDETFFAWLDDELDAAEAARVAAEVAADPRLAAIAGEHRAMQDRLKGGFDTLLDEPVPTTLVAAIRSPRPAEIIDFAEARGRRAPRRWSFVAQLGSIAATLVIGVLVGTGLPRPQSGSPVEVRGGKLYASASLGRALETQLASAPEANVRIGLTFRDHAGSICRSFTGIASSGLACRADGRWQLRGLLATPQGQATDYRMASSVDPALAALIDSTMAGEPFDARQEHSAREGNWK